MFYFCYYRWLDQTFPDVDSRTRRGLVIAHGLLPHEDDAFWNRIISTPGKRRIKRELVTAVRAFIPDPTERKKLLAKLRRAHRRQDPHGYHIT